MTLTFTEILWVGNSSWWTACWSNKKSFCLWDGTYETWPPPGLFCFYYPHYRNQHYYWHLWDTRIWQTFRDSWCNYQTLWYGHIQWMGWKKKNRVSNKRAKGEEASDSTIYRSKAATELINWFSFNVLDTFFVMLYYFVIMNCFIRFLLKLKKSWTPSAFLLNWVVIL